jgi:two-component system chemotaxis response regulator CheY
MKIWIVDDAIFMRKILKNMIQHQFGTMIEFEEFSNGKQCVDAYQHAMLQEERIDLILMDITMPQMDGITALKEILKINSFASVVMCSSLTSPKNIVQCVQSGAKHVISKPFIERDVLSTIESFLVSIEYDENGLVLNMDEVTFRILVSLGRIKDIKGYIRSGFNFSSYETGKAIVQVLEKSESEEMLELFLEHEEKLHKKTKHMLKGFRLRQLTNVSWNGEVKQ